jgi:arylsulfatase A-like enzyme
MPKGGGPSEADMSDKPMYLRRASEPNRAERAALTSLSRQRAESVFVMDRQIARLVKSLKRTGEWSNTVFMFTSDNGYYLGEHRHRTGKVFAHEPSLRTPFLVTGPGLREAGKRYDPISTVDISATILDLGGATAPHPADGTSKLATMRKGDQGWNVPVVTEAAVPHRHLKRSPGFHDARTAIGLRTPRYSYIRNRVGRSELYDLVKDPLELRNAIRSDRYAPVRRMLERVWTQVKDCSAATCRTPMPEALQATPKHSRTMTRAYWAAVKRVYGW